MNVDRATFKAAAITLALAAPVYYTLEAIFVFGDRVLLALEAPPEDGRVGLPAVAAARVELSLEPPAAEPARTLPVAETLPAAENEP